MKLINMFFAIILEAIKLTFNKQDSETASELPMGDVSELTDHQIEIKSQEGYLELMKEYNVGLFSKWLFFTICLVTLCAGTYLLLLKSPVSIIPLILFAPLYKIYTNIKGMADTRLSVLEFMFITQREIDKIKESI